MISVFQVWLTHGALIYQPVLHFYLKHEIRVSKVVFSHSSLAEFLRKGYANAPIRATESSSACFSFLV